MLMPQKLINKTASDDEKRDSRSWITQNNQANSWAILQTNRVADFRKAMSFYFVARKSLLCG